MAVYMNRNRIFWEPNPDYYERQRRDIQNTKDVPVEGDSGKTKKKNKGRCTKFFTYFAETTSFMGIPKIWASPWIPLKVMWCLFFLGATVVMIIQLVELFNSFYSYPVKTSVKLGFRPLPFPAVTICNRNPIKLSRAHQLSCDLQKVLELHPDDQSPDCVDAELPYDYAASTETELYCEEDGECYEEEVVGLDKHYVRSEFIADLLAEEDIYVRKEVGHSLEDMLLECSLNGRLCYSDNFTHFLSKELGNCYTFDSRGIRSKRSGPESGLSMVLNLEPEEFIETFKTGYGLRVVVHERGTRAFPGSEGFTVSAGSETSITMKLVEVERIGKPHGSCNDSSSFKKKFGVGYTERACREFCQKTIVIEKCQCFPDYYEETEEDDRKNNIRICNTEQDWDCEDKAYSKYMTDTGKGIDVCKCGNPCQEKVYETRVTSRGWPVISHIKTLESEVCKWDEFSPKCNYVDFDFDNLDYRLNSFLKVKVYFESLNYENVQEEPFYDTERFLSDIGGTMGLWVGVSVLSLAEIIEFFIHSIMCCFTSR